MKEKLLKIESYITSVPKFIKSSINHSITALQSLLDQTKDIVNTNYNLGLFHLKNANIADAKFRFSMVIKMRPDFAEAHYNLARCHLFDLNPEKAITQLKKSLEIKSDFKEAEFRLKFIQKQVDHTSIPLQVISEDYDCLALQYNSFMLEQIGYDAPEIVANYLKDYLESNSQVIDLGCGTGLAGIYLSKIQKINNLLGIDISSKMISETENLEIDESKVYSEVIKLDFNNLDSLKRKFNIIISLLSVGSSPDIDQFFNQVSKICSKNTIFAINCIMSEVDNYSFNYDYGYFSYTKEYLESYFQKYNWEIIKFEEIKLFKDNTKGLIFILNKY